jgi:hypothetical protein
MIESFEVIGGLQLIEPTEVDNPARLGLSCRVYPEVN